MPELPEVQTTVNGLQKLLPGLKIIDVWTDLAVGAHTTPHLRESLKDTKFFARFKKEVTGAKIISAERRAKNILINLATGKTILVHMKMTGHMMIGKYMFDSKKKIWTPDPSEKNQALRDPYNKFLHVVFTLSNGKHLVLSDARKFAKVTLLSTKEARDSIHLEHLGPEPLTAGFTETKMIERVMKRPNGKIKQVLMDQSIIAGIGNIYSDEMLWLASIHPESQPKNIPKPRMKILYTSLKKVLAQGIDFGGDSTSDYRNINGERGDFQHHHNVYRSTGKKCLKKNCSGIIVRKVVGGRSAHFCPVHQKKY